jgi:hypothetical protein
LQHFFTLHSSKNIFLTRVWEADLLADLQTLVICLLLLIADLHDFLGEALGELLPEEVPCVVLLLLVLVEDPGVQACVCQVIRQFYISPPSPHVTV